MAGVTKAEAKRYLENLSYRRVAVIILLFMIGGTVFYHFVEDWRWLDAAYFTFITLATVGYGDFAPKTDVGKVFTMVYVLFGVTLFIVLAKLLLVGVATRKAGKSKK